MNRKKRLAVIEDKLNRSRKDCGPLPGIVRIAMTEEEAKEAEKELDRAKNVGMRVLIKGVDCSLPRESFITSSGSRVEERAPDVEEPDLLEGVPVVLSNGKIVKGGRKEKKNEHQ